MCNISAQFVCDIIVSLSINALSIDILHFLTLLVIYAIYEQDGISDTSVTFTVKGLG